MTRTLITAAALVAAAAGLASQADAARFLLTNGTRLYTGTLGSNGAVSDTIGGAAGLGNSPALGFDSKGNLYGAFVGAGTTQFRQITGWDTNNTFDPMVGAVIGQTDAQTNSFDFRGTGANERLIGTRNRMGGDPGAGPIYFESDDSTYSSFSDVGATGVGANGSFPSTGYDRGDGTYWAITAGTDGDGASNRRILTINTASGAANVEGNLTFGAADYGNIVLAGGDFVEALDTLYLSFFSQDLNEVVIGSVDLQAGVNFGLFTELTRFGLVGANQGTMGLAIIIPTPLAGGMGAAGLLFVGARRRRNG